MRSTAPLVLFSLALGLASLGCSGEAWDPSPPLARQAVGDEAPLLKPGTDRDQDRQVSCTDRRGQAEIDVARAISEADHGCAVDADCVTFTPATRCFSACPQLVNRRKLAEVAAATEQIDEQWCPSFQDECGEPERPSSCEALHPQCVAGLCTSPTTD